MKILVSIITSTFNHENYISNCIRSLLNQTYSHWEMIIIDDASTDRTYEIALSYSKKDKRIKTLRHKTNWGIKKLKDSYNQALKIAKGKLIAVLEGDDFWPKEKLEKQIKDFEDKDVVLSYGDWIMTDENGYSVDLRDYRKFNKNYLNNDPVGSILNLFSTLRFDIASPTVMIRKKALIKIRGFKSGKYYPFVDIPTYLELTQIGNFKYHQEILGYYRRTENSSWFKFAQQSSTVGREEIKKEIDDFIKRKKLKIFINKLAQQKYLKKRKKTKFLSILLNQALYKNRFFICIKIFLRINFWLKYLKYKFNI